MCRNISLIYTEACISDIDQLIHIRYEEQSEIYPAMSAYPNFKEDLQKYFKQAIMSEEKKIFVVKDVNNIVATMIFSIEQQPPQFFDNGKYAYLCNVYTDRKYRRKGIQNKMYQMAVNCLMKENVAALYCDTHMPQMVSFLTKMKWTNSKEYYNIYLRKTII